MLPPLPMSLVLVHLEASWHWLHWAWGKFLAASDSVNTFLSFLTAKTLPSKPNALSSSSSGFTLKLEEDQRESEGRDINFGTECFQKEALWNIKGREGGKW